ncbi:MAG: isoleucine--tRNA ligase [Spirochaetia bacterium]
MYRPVNPKTNFPQQEEEILAFWQENQIFKKSLDQRADATLFTQYDGPPFATGLPHYGHLVQSALKDTFPRYYTMKGYHVPRRFGWDCHGLPVEYEIEKELGISGKSQIEDFGVANFNEKCREVVLRYAGEWRKYVTRLGRWVDFDDDYKTMDADFMESIWYVFQQLWKKKLVEEGHYILPYCPRCSTVLSNHELNLGGYKDVTDQSASVRFRSLNEKNTYFIAWTTTPWTLPSNLALAVGPDIDYVKVKDTQGVHYILAKNRIDHYFEEGKFSLIWTKKGQQLAGMQYEPLFDYFSNLASVGAFCVFVGDYVTAESGTGIVHTANGFGEDDYNLLKDTQIPTVSPIDAECQFTSEIPEYEGRFVKDCDKDILAHLHEEGKLVKKENYLHSYPHCYRCSHPLIYRAISSWFVRVPQIRDRMLAANAQIQWIPGHLKEGRFGKWLANARDWAISRNRFWGNPIPIWRCQNCDQTTVIGSRKELKERSGQDPADLHKHHVDQITFSCGACGGTMQRITEVFDCWFESGSMPYAQNHYPFENEKIFEENFPADFIAEGIDQTRGWFYTLTILAAALFDRPAFKMCVTTGLVLAADGRKMSKSLRNYTDPLEVVNQYGADSTRLYLLSSAVTRGDDLKFSEDGIKEILKSVIIPFWNAYSFFVTYANIDNFQPTGNISELDHPLDHWIVSSSWRLVMQIDEAMGDGEVHKAIHAIIQFIDELNNWYIRRSRRRFWKSENDEDKLHAYETLFFVLTTLTKVSAPFLPFLSEAIYQNLKLESSPQSVHLCDWPVVPKSARDFLLEDKMALAMQAVAMGHSLRSLHNLKNRLPLQRVYVVSRDSVQRGILSEMSAILAEELNVKQVEIQDNEEQLVTYQAKANYRVLGGILGPDMNVAAQAISHLTQEQIQGILSGAIIMITFDGKTHKKLEIDQTKVAILREEKENFKAINEGTLTVALDTQITQELLDEGAMRDLVRAIQNLRKTQDLQVSQRIKLWVHGPVDVERVYKEFSNIICDETLTSELLWQHHPSAIAVDCGDHQAHIMLEKN